MYGIQHEMSSPHFQSSSGEAERAVQTIRNLWKKADDKQLVLLDYRTTSLKCKFVAFTTVNGQKTLEYLARFQCTSKADSGQLQTGQTVAQIKKSGTRNFTSTKEWASRTICLYKRVHQLVPTCLNTTLAGSQGLYSTKETSFVRISSNV